MVNFRSRIVLVVLSVITLSSSVWADEVKPVSLPVVDCNNFCFAVIGDREGRERSGIFPVVIEKLNLLDPDFVVSVGDSVPGYTSDVNNINAQWDEFDKLIQPLKMPFLKTVGNHDMTNETMAGIYTKRYGRTYFHAVYKDTLFMFISTEDPYSKEPNETKNKMDKLRDGTFKESKEDKALLKMKKRLKAGGYKDAKGMKEYEKKHRDFRGSKITDQQVEYFKNVLEQNKNVRWTFVIMHKHAYEETNPPANWLKIEKMLAERPYTVFSGHEHRYQYLNRNGRDYIAMATVGGGQKNPPQTRPGIYDSVMLVNMRGNEPVFAHVLIDGVFDKTDVRKAKVLLDAELEKVHQTQAED